MDISDERTEILSQEDIIYAKQTVIHEPSGNQSEGAMGNEPATPCKDRCKFLLV